MTRRLDSELARARELIETTRERIEGTRSRVEDSQRQQDEISRNMGTCAQVLAEARSKS